MTQVRSILHREPVEPTKRKPLTPAQRREILARQNDLCGECDASLIWQVVEGRKVYGPVIDEHVLRLFVGGSNELRNRQLWCVACSKAKTKAEAPQNAKVRRILAWDEPAEPSRIHSRGFDQRLSKGVNGKVKPRKQRRKCSPTFQQAWSGGTERSDCETDYNTNHKDPL